MKMWIGLVLFFLSIQTLNAQVQSLGPINFGGGVNYQVTATDLPDNQSPDMCNLVPNLDGSLSKRFGSELFIEQPLSSQAVSALYRAYATSGTATIVKHTLAVIGNKIVVSTSDTIPRQWVVLSTNITPNQKWNFVAWENDVFMTGDKLTDDIFRYNVLKSSLTTLWEFGNIVSTSETIKLRAKYLTKKGNYLLFSNVADVTNGTTYYTNRVYYSYLNRPSSVTFLRFEEIRTGEEITGMDVMFDKINIFFPSSIHEIDFTILDPVTGDQVINEVVRGFGLKAPASLVNTGQFYLFLAQDGIRTWDGGRRSRLDLTQESRIVSFELKNLIDKLIGRGLYSKAIGKYYKKREWYIFSYNDPDKFPKNANNSILIYDLRLKQWYPICGWLANSFETLDGIDDNGELLYGSSSDGLVYRADIESKIDDSPQQIVVDPMESSSAWKGTNITISSVAKEGNNSLRMYVDNSINSSSMTLMKVLNFGEWNDKRKITKDDNLFFQVNITSLGNLENLRIDLLVEDREDTFSNNFTSVTFSSSAIFNLFGVKENNVWGDIKVKLSSFPILDSWTNLNQENFPFANTLTFYGLRFVANNGGNGVGVSSISIDNVRIVQNKDSPNNFYRFTKLYDFGVVNDKTFGEILLTVNKSPDSLFLFDIYNNFGANIRTVTSTASIPPQELIAIGVINSTDITVMDDNDFSIKRSTTLSPVSNYRPSNGTADKNFIYLSNRSDFSILKIDRNFNAIVSSFGSLGTGATNFNVPHQLVLDKNENIYMTDSLNHRLKIHSSRNLNAKAVRGELGVGATNFHAPTGISLNDSFLTVIDEGNFKIKKISIEPFGSVLLQKNLDFNMASEASLAEDENLIYLAYNKISESAVYNLDLFLESRNKGDYSIVNRVNIAPRGFETVPGTYTLVGNIALKGRYIYVAFADTFHVPPTKYYIQKRLKKDFSLVKEFSTNQKIWSIIGDPHPYLPIINTIKEELRTDARYIQLKYYDEGIDNDVSLLNQTFIIKQQSLKF